ncbi:MAG: DNA gyrase inhibitor YacG [Gammaproteobacteria bacterium]|nr:MAG: DNA gyrase inhibitor YacG [Gammaproteobacteria bacterium]
MTKMVNCPECGKPVAWIEESLFRPFCSKRCQQLDFGGWANESFSIPGEEVYPDADQDERGQH